MSSLSCSQPTRRALFVFYALALATATHWPGLAIAAPHFSRLDLLIHAAVFAGWTILLTASAFFGPVLSRRNVMRAVAVAFAYAILDELTQGIPIIRRTVDPLDLAANATGIVLAAVGIALVARAQRPTTTYN